MSQIVALGRVPRDDAEYDIEATAVTDRIMSKPIRGWLPPVLGRPIPPRWRGSAATAAPVSRVGSANNRCCGRP